MGEGIVQKMKRLAAQHQAELNAATAATAAATAQNNAPIKDIADKAALIEAEDIPEKQDASEVQSTPEARRRARTHRLVQIGAICDQYLGTRDMHPQQVQKLLNEIAQQNKSIKGQER